MKFGWQQMIIWKLFKDLKGAASKQMRKKAVALTGLTLKQIYKWIFDRILSARKGADFYQLPSEAPPDESTSVRQVSGDHDYSKVKSVFLIEKISRP
jgi:hypothetical protein